MKKIGIVIDEISDLPQVIAQENQIEVVMAKYEWPELDAQEGENTFQKMRELERKGIESFGKTSQPSPKDFLDAYKKQLESFDEIVCINVSSKLSGTHNSAIQAIKFLPQEEQNKIFVIDTLSASVGEGLFAIKALDLIKQGKGAEEIAKELNSYISQIKAFVVVKDIKWIEMAGRISSLGANIVRKMDQAGIKPLLSFKKGLLKPAGLSAGAKDVATALFTRFQKENKIKDGRKIKVAIAHGDDSEGAQKLKEMIEKEFETADFVIENIVGDLLGTLAGPDSLILAWYKD